MPFSNFTHLKRVTNNTGLIPPKLLPAQWVIFRHDFELDFDILSLSSADYMLRTVGAKYEVRSPGGTLILAWGWTVQYTISYQIAADGFGSPLLSFWSWYASKQAVTVTAPAPAPTELGSPDGIAIPGGGSDYTDNTGIIQQTFESPAFRVSIPVGSTVKITFHSAGFPALISIASLSVATRLAPAGISGFRYASDGEASLIYPGADGLRQVRSTGRDRAFADDKLLVDAAGKAWAADGGGLLVRSLQGARQAIIYNQNPNIVVRESGDDGRQYGDPMTITAYSGYSLLGGAKLHTGQTILLLASSAGALFIGYRDRDGTFAPPVAAKTPSGLTFADAGLLIVGQGAILDFYYVDSNQAVQHISSNNDGLLWT